MKNLLITSILLLSISSLSLNAQVDTFEVKVGNKSFIFEETSSVNEEDGIRTIIETYQNNLENEVGTLDDAKSNTNQESKSFSGEATTNRVSQNEKNAFQTNKPGINNHNRQFNPSIENLL